MPEVKLLLVNQWLIVEYIAYFPWLKCCRLVFVKSFDYA